MALVTLLAIVPLVLLMNLLVLPHIAGWPLVLRTLLFSGTLTGLMTWVVMPRITRLFRRFLYGGR
jgi:antibiotic biosynthesis monooxygenase (ABM) superfamily enzyme